MMPLQKGGNIYNFLYATAGAILCNRLEDSCPVPLHSQGVVPHSALRPCSIQVSGLHSGSAVNKASPS